MDPSCRTVKRAEKKRSLLLAGAIQRGKAEKGDLLCEGRGVDLSRGEGGASLPEEPEKNVHEASGEKKGDNSRGRPSSEGVRQETRQDQPAFFLGANGQNMEESLPGLKEADSHSPLDSPAPKGIYTAEGLRQLIPPSGEGRCMGRGESHYLWNHHEGGDQSYRSCRSGSALSKREKKIQVARKRKKGTYMEPHRERLFYQKM